MKIFKLVKKCILWEHQLNFITSGFREDFMHPTHFQHFGGNVPGFLFLAYTGKEASLTSSVRTPQTVITGSYCSTAV